MENNNTSTPQSEETKDLSLIEEELRISDPELFGYKF